MRHIRALMKITAVGALTAATLAVPVVTPAVAAPALPTGFILQDDSAIAIGKAGQVNWVPKTGTPRTLGTIAVTNKNDLGLVGVAVAPDFATSRTIYTTYATAAAGPPWTLRLSRWQVSVDGAGAPTGLQNETPILETTADSDAHAMTTVLAPDDGTLWVSIGDGASYAGADQQAFRVQNIDDPHGKVLHIRTDGTGVPTNPFYQAGNPGSVRSKVYAYGFRSPFRFSVDAATGQIALGDVGFNRTEEVDLVGPGQNFGWPCWEGPDRTVEYINFAECGTSTTVNPIFSYPHPYGNSVTGGVVYKGSSYPDDYKGRYFFGDYVANRIWTMRFNGAGNVLTQPEQDGFAQDIGGPVRFQSMPSNGDIVYADILSRTLRRITWAPGNAAPQAVPKATVDPDHRTVSFDATASTDPNGDPLTYKWDFGDGTTGTGPTTSRTYGPGDTFTAKLTATDPLGLTGTTSIVVAPGNHPPALNLTPPDAAHEYAVGEVIQASATAADQEDGSLQVLWTTNLVHCVSTGGCHLHPSSNQTGPQYSMPFEGHPGNSYLEVTAHATDSKGTETTTVFRAKAKQRRVTVQTDTPAAFTIGDEQGTSGLFSVGQQLTIVAPQVATDGVAQFQNWADGSANRTKVITVPDGDSVINVTYLTPIEKRYQDDAALRAQLGAPVGAEQGDSLARSQQYANGYLFWSPSGGVRSMQGDYLNAYLAVGGVAKLGVPTTDVVTNPDGAGTRIMLSKGGAIYKSPNTPAAALQADNYALYKSLGAEAGALGYPTDNERTSGGDLSGHYNTFADAIIIASPTTPSQVLRGEVKNKYVALGYGNAYVGFPVSNDEAGANGGRGAGFQRGYIYWKQDTGAHNVEGAIGAKWAEKGKDTSYLGYPTTDDLGTTPAGGYFNFFERGSIFWTADTGAHNVQGAISDKWNELGREHSYPGYPTSDEMPGANGGFFNQFQRGGIYWSAATGAHNVEGAIGVKYAELGNEKSFLGYPTTDDLATTPPGGYFNLFERGAIYWSAGAGAHNVQGGIWQKFGQLNYEHGLGFPLTDEIPGANGGFYNHFERGSIYWSPGYGSHNVQGAILMKYLELGGDASWLGYPIGDETAIPGGWRSNFEHGYIFFGTNGQYSIQQY
ncbi:PQQ-dependent sugar dehydrogenase [Actinocrispum sp. NPDC049592]|uniref:PQQ-dependent sugar dehydrogenase n=1 Tax=Actinocrispum sp. NPDC049592 TaxID=3154835 RepID=UPI0034353083